MTEYIAALVSAAALMVGGIAMVHRALAGHGRHRSPFRQPPMLSRPVDALDRVAALCSAEGQVTQHARMSITGQFICIDCHQPSADPASYETREEAPRA